jgi:flagellar motor switch protein FliN/FliY
MVLDTAAKSAAAKKGADTPAPDRTFEGFLDVPLRVRVELGRRRLKCAEVIALQVGGIISLRRSAGENVALLVNGIRVGVGEIVVIEDSMGLRITDLVPREPGRNA